MGLLKKIQPFRPSRFAGYREHIYECLVLLNRIGYNFDLPEPIGFLRLFARLTIVATVRQYKAFANASRVAFD